jgi:hypothetical protein
MLGHAINTALLKLQISNEYRKVFSRMTTAGS